MLRNFSPLILMACILLQQCASLQSVSLTQIPEQRSGRVSAESSRWIILALNFDNDYVDKAVSDLQQKCRGGQIRGVLTKDENYMYFGFFVMKRVVKVSGYCEKRSA
jgi:hypothetical protein